VFTIFLVNLIIFTIVCKLKINTNKNNKIKEKYGELFPFLWKKNSSSYLLPSFGEGEINSSSIIKI
jgi:hypothetical protein